MRLWGKAVWQLTAVVWLAALAPAQAQNLDAGKSAAQLVNEVCTACHRSTRELRRPSAAFLRQHYTSSAEAASAIASYLASVPAGAPQPKRPPGSSPAANAAPAPSGPVEANHQAATEREQPKGAAAQALPKGKRPPASLTAEVKPPEAAAPAPTPTPTPALEPFLE